MEPFSITQGKYHKSRQFQRESFTMPNMRNKATIATDPTNPIATDPDTQEVTDLQAKKYVDQLIKIVKFAQDNNADFGWG